jgi:hypothetical protein
MQIHVPSCGLLPLIPSSKNSRDFVSEFPGRNTSTTLADLNYDGIPKSVFQ